MAEHRSIKKVVRSAIAQDKLARRSLEKERTSHFAKTADSLQNFAAALGIGTNNLSSASTYGFNPITRIRTQLEWIHRGSWLGGVAVDLVADDMTRAGVEIKGDLNPDQIEQIEEKAVTLRLWPALNETLKWDRLYGGCLAMMLIDGQDVKTPFRLETVGKNQFRGLLVLDRWQVEPSLGDLVTELGPNLGLPKFYRITNDAPGLAGKQIHYSRCARLDGIRVPYWQRLMENLWGISVIERMYDRMVAFDSASTGASQLVYKSYLRTFKIDGFRELLSSGGAFYQALLKQVSFMRETQSIEGMTLIDAKDSYEEHGGASSFAGLGEALTQFAQQIAGALQIPLTRLLGQSPAGLNSTGESDLRTYYDGINQKQESTLRSPVTTMYRAVAQSEGIKVPPGFRINFRPLWQLTETEKAAIAKSDTDMVMSARDSGVPLSDQTFLRELKQNARVTGRWTNITKEQIDEASDMPAPPPMAPLPGEPGEPGESQPSHDSATKLTQIEADYHSTGGTATKRCDICRRFEAPNGCRIVDGKIEPDGWCRFFVAKS